MSIIKSVLVWFVCFLISAVIFEVLIKMSIIGIILSAFSLLLDILFWNLKISKFFGSLGEHPKNNKT